MVKSIYDLCIYMKKEFAGRTAIQFYQDDILHSITYDQLVKDIESASAFISDHTKPGTHIGIIGRNSYEFIVCFLAVMRSGRVAVPMNKDHMIEDIHECIRYADVQCLCYDNEEHETIIQLKEKISIDAFSLDKLLLYDAVNNDGKSEIEDELACILLTSGTSSKPKGVMLSSSNYLAGIIFTKEAQPFKDMIIYLYITCTHMGVV